MKKLSSEVKTGILVTVTIAIMIWGFNLLKGRNIFHRDRNFYAVYNNVEGLTANNPVQIHGYKAGQVRDLYLYPDNSGRVVVLFSISGSNFVIPKNSTARIISDGLLGSKAVSIELGDSKVFAKNGDTLNAGIQASLQEQMSDAIRPLRDKARAVMQSIDSVMIIVQEILNKDARSSLTASFESVKRAIATLEKTAGKLDALVESESGKISSILSKLDKITGTIASNNDKLSNVMKNFSAISDSLVKVNIKATIENAELTLQRTAILLDKINKGEGSAGLLMNDKSLYRHLDSTSVNLSRLFDDMRLHPKRYVHFSVFGKKERKVSKTEVEDLKKKVDQIMKENEELKKQIDLLQKK